MRSTTATSPWIVGRRRNAEIDFLAANGEPQTVHVLRRSGRSAMFRPGHHLDARDERRFKMRRQRFLVAQCSVDAEAHFDRAFRRFDMDIGGVRFGGPRDQAVDRAYDGRVAGEILEALDIGVVIVLRTRHPSSCGWFGAP